MLRETGVNGVWIARGAIGNPFIFREVRELLAGRPLPPPPTIGEQRAAIEEHLRLTSETHGAERAGIVTRKLCIRYADLHPLRDDVRQAFIDTRTAADLDAAIARWYDPAASWPGVARRSKFDLVAAGTVEE